MGRHRTTKAGLLAVAIAFGLGARSQAATAFSITDYEVGPGFDRFAAFDPSLGTLLSVHVQIFGDIVPLILSDATAEVEPLTVTQSFISFAGKGFRTLAPATINGFILSTTPDAPALAFAPYLDEFTFDAVTEASGFAADSYGANLTAHLADFLPGGPSGDQIIEFPTYLAFALGSSGALLPSISTFLAGAGTVTYTYELAATGSGVPEP
ncbi:MAG TPA: choice-of-anchor E domain-containing protein, partial [Phenylobacterium sp.]